MDEELLEKKAEIYNRLLHDLPEMSAEEKMWRWTLGLHYIVHELHPNLAYLSDHGEIFSHEVAREMIQSIERFYSGVTPEEIKTLNSSVSTKETRERSKGSPRKYPGYVYLLQANTGHYKIGRTSDPTNRAKTFGIQLPMQVEFICTIKTNDMHELEKQLHTRFANKRLNGEWFDLNQDDVAYIKNLSESQL